MKTSVRLRSKIAQVVLVTIFSFGAYATPLKGFYKSDTNQLTGYALKTALKKIISRTHKSRGYGSLMNVYFKSDVDRTNDKDGSIVDMYSENPRSYDPYKFSTRSHKCGTYKRESDCFNREHIFPQGIFKKAAPMRSDFYHVYPTDGYVNGRRSSHPFGEVEKVSWSSENGSKVGTNKSSGFNGTVFEPIDEFKGDIARALFYFATRYEDKVSRWRHAMINGTSDQVYKTWLVKVLLKWHKMDPVSEHEKRRNEVGSSYQGNRNPFIDTPHWVEDIWGHLE